MATCGWPVVWMVTAGVVHAACATADTPARFSEDAAPPNDAVDAATSAAPVDAAAPDAPVDGAPPAPDAGVDAGTALWPSGYVPDLRDLAFGCKLINNRNIDDPTPNQTHYRANVRGANLGIPVHHGDDLFLFFGDTAGAEFIWPLGPESLPDAVGYAAVPYDTVAADPTALCDQLRFLVTGAASGPVESDFAGAHMTPPTGRSIDEFVHYPAGPRGESLFPNLPGDLEVPSGAFSHGGSIYVLYTIASVDPLEMRGSYLARWQTPSTTGLPNYDILYHVDQRFDTSGPLGGDFINIAALVGDEYVYLYGTGARRASPVHLARKRLATLHTAGGFERYDAASSTWVASDSAAAPVVATPHLGELSVRYFPDIGRYVLLDQELSSIVARFAQSPEGPWSAPVTVAKMDDPPFAERYCCLGTDCPGERMFECDHAGFYATYMLPDATINPDGSVSISFVMSTGTPYNVALMTATFE